MEAAVQTAWQFARGRTLPPPPKLSDALESSKMLEARFLQALGRLTPSDRLELWPELAGTLTNVAVALESIDPKAEATHQPSGLKAKPQT